jgi:hypothetical protein
VAHLLAGGRRAVVCLEEAPVEVALHRRGEQVSLSVLATSPAPALLADDVRLPLDALRDADRRARLVAEATETSVASKTAVFATTRRVVPVSATPPEGQFVPVTSFAL